MKILVVDDNYDKAEEIKRYIPSGVSCNIDNAQSVRNALENMKVTRYDVLITDIQLPLVYGDEVSVDGGVQLIKSLFSSDIIKSPLFIISMTSHVSSINDHARFFKEHGIPMLQSGVDISNLKSILLARSKIVSSETHEFDIAVITALPEELDAVLNVDLEWGEPITIPGDGNFYHTGKMRLESGEVKKVVAVSCIRMGMPTASATSAKLLLKFNPKLIVMTGIAAGIKSRTQLGDVLVADCVWDWGSGKITEDGGETKFLQAPHQLSIDPTFKAAFLEVQRKREWLDEILTGWPAENRPSGSVNIHIGPVASGAAVIENMNVIENIKGQHRAVVGVEMEGYGVAQAASVVSGDKVKALVIKSVCDFADPSKNDNWHKFAAYTSAELALRFVRKYYS